MLAGHSTVGAAALAMVSGWAAISIGGIIESGDGTRGTAAAGIGGGIPAHGVRPFVRSRGGIKDTVEAALDFWGHSESIR